MNDYEKRLAALEKVVKELLDRVGIIDEASIENRNRIEDIEKDLESNED